MEGYWTVSEYARECNMKRSEVETAIKRGLLVTKKFNRIRYIPKTMPRYRVVRIPKGWHSNWRYVFIAETNYLYLRRRILNA